MPKPGAKTAEAELGGDELDPKLEDEGSEGLEDAGPGAAGAGEGAVDDGAEGGEAGAGDQGGEGGAEEGLEEAEGEAGAEEETEKSEVALLKVQLSNLTARLEKAEKEQVRDEGVKEPTEEEWAKIEEETGLGRQAIKFQTRQMATVLQRALAYVDSKMGKFEKDAAIGTISHEEGFEDISKYRQGIEEYLKEFNPAGHSDPKLLKMAYFYAKGKGAGKVIKRAINSRETNRRIIKKGTGHGTPGGKGTKTVIKLSEGEKEAARLAGMSEAEYQKYKRPLSEIRGR